MRALKWAGGILLGLVLLAIGGVVALTMALDAGALSPRILAAIEASTGRAATLGAVSLRPGLSPRVEVQGATLANLPGGSRPEMATIRRLEVRLALLPLLRGDVRIEGIEIDGADILLERTAGGAPNWLFRAAPRDPAPTGPTTPARPATPPPPKVVRECILTDSPQTLPAARHGIVSVARARVEGIGSGRPPGLAARIGVLGLTATIEGDAWPEGDAIGAIRGSLLAGGNRIGVEGRPGTSLRVTLALPEPAGLRPLLAALVPGLPEAAPLPPVEAAFTLDAALRPTEVTATFGAADLGALREGLALTRASLSAPALDQPAEVRIEATRAGLAVATTIRIETPAALLADRPVSALVEAAAAGATLRAEGRIEAPLGRSGGTAALRLAIPDLAALAPLLPDPPPLTDLDIEADLALPAGLDGEIRVRRFRVTSPLLAAEGDLALRPGRPLGVTGRVAATHADLDTLGERLAARAATGTPAAAPSPAPTPLPAPAPAPARSGERRVIPDIPLPIAAVRAYQGRVAVSATELILGGAAWREVRGTLAIADGVAHLTPFAAVTPGGPVQGQVTIDAAQSPPAIAFAIQSDGAGLDLAALRIARHEAASIHGRAQIRIEGHGRGATTRALAGTLTGEAGLALVNGRLDRAGMLRLGPDLLGLLLPGAPQEGLDLRCFAVRISAEDGMATTQALLAETSAGRIEGSVAVNLRSEAIAARLLPDVTLLGVRVRAPVGVGGTLAAPRIGAEPARALAQVVEDTVANRLWRDPTVDWLRGRIAGGHPAGDCAAQLRLARFGADGPVPPPQEIVPGVPRELQGTTQELLRGLGGLFGGGRR